MSSVAVAAPVTYDFHGDFTAPATGSFSGSFVYDYDLDRVTSGTVSITAGVAVNGDPRPAAILPFQNKIFSIVYFIAPDSVSNSPVAQLNVARDVNNRSLTLLELFAGYCDTKCSGYIVAPELTRIGPVIVEAKPVPTLSEWAMIVLGLTLAGTAAVYIQRRRFRV